MTTYRIYARAFHPDRTFGLGGLGFEGDSRGFAHAVSSGVTSRIWAYWDLNMSTFSVIDKKVRSDPSEGVLGEGSPFLGRQEYEDPETKPTQSESFSASLLFADATYSSNFQWAFRGVNHAFTSSTSVNNVIVPDLDLEGSIAFSILRNGDLRSMTIGFVA